MKKYSEKLGVWFYVKDSALEIEQFDKLIEEFIEKCETVMDWLFKYKPTSASSSARTFVIAPYFCVDKESIYIEFYDKDIDYAPIDFPVYRMHKMIVRNKYGKTLGEFTACGETNGAACTNLMNLILANPFDEEVTFESRPTELTVNPCRIVKTYL